METDAHQFELGSLAGRRLRLKKELSLRGSDQIHHVGEIWQVHHVEVGSAQAVVLLRKPNGSPHLWTGNAIWQWFEDVTKEEPNPVARANAGGRPFCFQSRWPRGSA